MIEILSLYNPIPNQDKAKFKARTVHQSFKKNELVLLDGEIQEELILVKKGTLMLFFDHEGKTEVIDFAYLRRFCIDLESFSKQTPSNYCIKCMEDVELETIRYEDLQDFFDASPAAERAYRILLETILASTVKRILNQHILTIQERFDKLIADRPELFKIVAHKYIASYLNIDPTNFSKMYNKCVNRPIRFW